MPKKTRLQKLKKKMRNEELSAVVSMPTQTDPFFTNDLSFRKDLMKSILFAVCITGFEIALYFIYYKASI